MLKTRGIYARQNYYRKIQNAFKYYTSIRKRIAEQRTTHTLFTLIDLSLKRQ